MSVFEVNVVEGQLGNPSGESISIWVSDKFCFPIISRIFWYILRDASAWIIARNAFSSVHLSFYA